MVYADPNIQKFAGVHPLEVFAVALSIGLGVCILVFGSTALARYLRNRKRMAVFRHRHGDSGAAAPMCDLRQVDDEDPRPVTPVSAWQDNCGPPIPASADPGTAHAAAHAHSPGSQARIGPKGSWIVNSISHDSISDANAASSSSALVPPVPPMSSSQGGSLYGQEHQMLSVVVVEQPRAEREQDRGEDAGADDHGPADWSDQEGPERLC